MSPRARRLLALAALAGLLSGCVHRSAPAAGAGKSAATESRPAAAATHDAGLPPATRRSTPGTPFTRARPAEPFSPLLVATTQVAHDDLFLHVLAGSSGASYQPVTRLYRGQRVFILPFARNYAFDALENADLTFELSVMKPDGSLDGPPLSVSLWQGAVSAPDLVLFPATTISFYAEPHDPVGDYRLVVRIHDHLGGDTRELAQTFTLLDYTPPPLPADFVPDAWFHRYYLAPSPELALPALPRFFDKLPADKRSSALPPLLGFYDQILIDNPWLLPAFAARLTSTTDTDEAFALSLVLGFHLRATATPPAGFDAALWDRLADFRRHTWPSDPDAPLLQASQLDALWGRFFASARYAPVQRLLEPLANTADLGAAERWRKSLQLEADANYPLPDLDDPETPADIRREILLRTALWSLRANARQHPLVRGYLEQTLRTGDLAPGARVLLERALRVDAASATPTS